MAMSHLYQNSLEYDNNFLKLKNFMDVLGFKV
jgi:hypothetical protein